jgi:hypothetical protein
MVGRWTALPRRQQQRLPPVLPLMRRPLLTGPPGLRGWPRAVGTNAVPISGFTHPATEFDIPYRAIGCSMRNDCRNDPWRRVGRKDTL